MQIKIKNNSQGFTLIELMVVISVMVILTSVVIANFSSLSQSRNLGESRDLLVADLRRMQASALSSRDSTNGNPASAYTVRVDTQTPNNTFYGLTVLDNQPTPASVSLGNVNLLSNITIAAGNGITITTAAGTTIHPAFATIYFTVPYSRVLVSYAGVSQEKDDTITITLTTPSGVAKNVVISGSTGNISAP